jgi:Family of unknown function (DUF6338)
MPTNLLGLVFFVFLIAPGLVAFTWRSFRPRPSTTVLTELAGFVFRSLICNGLALMVFLIAQTLWRTSTPDLDALVRNPGPYVRDHYWLVLGWSTGMLIVACAFAYVGARLFARAIEGEGWLSSLLQKSIPGTALAMQPAWWDLFLAMPTKLCYITCVLDDGTYLAGPLHSFNPTPSETSDRDLTLADPVQYRPQGGTELSRLGGTAGVGAVCISARRIKYFTVSFLDPDTPLPGAPLPVH